MQYINPAVRIRHFKQLNRTLWSVLVAAFSAMVMLTLMLTGAAQLASGELNLSWQESVFSLNQQYVEKNQKLNAVISKGEN